MKRRRYFYYHVPEIRAYSGKDTEILAQIDFVSTESKGLKIPLRNSCQHDRKFFFKKPYKNEDFKSSKYHQCEYLLSNLPGIQLLFNISNYATNIIFFRNAQH